MATLVAMDNDGHFHTHTRHGDEVVLAFEHKPQQPEKHPFERIREFYVCELRGTEALSTLFEYTLLLEGPLDALPPRGELGALMHQRAYFAWGGHLENGDAVNPTWGALREVALESVVLAPDGAFRAVVRVTLRPTIWDLSQVVRTGIFHEQSAVDILQAIARQHTPAITRLESGALRKPPPPREYTVQYQESDLDLVSRLLEHEGIFYFFTHDAGGDTLVLGDSNAALLGSSENSRRTLRWDYDKAGGRQPDSIATIRWRDRTAPAQVRLRDFDYRQASAELSSESRVDSSHALGAHGHFGDHFRTAADARRLATARLEELWAHQFELEAVSYARMLRAGERITLDAHPLGPEFDCTEWFVTSVRHALRQQSGETANSAVGARGVGVSDRSGYENTFTAVPLREKSSYRPARKTPRPRIVGLMTAKVDGTDNASDRHAPIDSEGRYRVIFPWPAHGLAVAGPSRWVRRAQLASGPNYGTHYPIHSGTEVVIAHLDGDPDRPVIVGSVPNPDHQSPVVTKNNSQAIFRTRAGVAVIVEDEST